MTSPLATGRQYMSSAIEPFWIEARTEHGSVAFDGQRSDDDGDVQEAITTALAEAVASGTSHPLDVHRGVLLQRLMSEALAGLATRDRLSRGDA